MLFITILLYGVNRVYKFLLACDMIFAYIIKPLINLIGGDFFSVVVILLSISMTLSSSAAEAEKAFAITLKTISETSNKPANFFINNYLR